MMSDPEKISEIKNEISPPVDSPAAESQDVPEVEPDKTGYSSASESPFNHFPHLSDDPKVDSQIHDLENMVTQFEQELEQRRRSLKEALKQPKMSARYFKGINPKIMHCFDTRNNVLKGSEKVIMPSEIIQSIVEICDPTTRVLVALTSKEMARHAAKVEHRLRKKPAGDKPPSTDLRKLEFMTSLRPWMGKKRGLCFQCLKFKHTTPAQWVGRPNHIAKAPRYRKERAAGPTCQACFAKGMLQVHAAREDIKRLKERIKRL